ncbi:MAG: UDP-4-amino-4,6-dideoxy-N-acetyl-beta-L-altrosamine N-acetyltransferase [Pontibacterium sp.]
MNNKMQILGTLRTIQPNELELMRSWRNAPNVRVNMYTRHEISQQEHLRWWESIAARPDQQYFMYEINGLPLGIIGFTGINTDSKNSAWAFYASPEAPPGTGSRMEFLALEYAFYTLNLHKLYCEVLAFNTPVIKLHQKFGFKVEGIFREHHNIDSTYADVYRLGLLATEWAEQSTLMYDKITKRLRG